MTQPKLPHFELLPYAVQAWQPPRGKQQKITTELRQARERADQLYTPILTLHLVRERAIPESVQITSPTDIYQLAQHYFDGLAQEHMVVMTLDTKNRVIAIVPVYIGSVHTSVVRIAEIIRPALLTNASGAVILHNHPSGDPTPSPEDAAITREIYRAFELMDIDLLDHIVMGESKFVSLRESGLGF